MMERARDLPLAQIRTIVAFDQERNATGVVGAARHANAPSSVSNSL
jgi:hypothetical protein